MAIELDRIGVVGRDVKVYPTHALATKPRELHLDQSPPMAVSARPRQQVDVKVGWILIDDRVRRSRGGRGTAG